MTATLTRNDTIPTAEPHATQAPPPRRNRRRRILTGLAGVAVAGVLLAVGMVTTSNADFANRYVTDQLVERKITFKPADALTDQERQSECVVANAGKPLTTAKQAECYANEFIGLHVKTVGKGRTYAELGEVQNGLRARIAAAQASGDPALAGLQKEMTDLTAQREQMFKGETMRGMLLTSYGFSVLGEKGTEAATVVYIGAGVVLLLSVAGLVVGLRTPRNES